MGEVQDACRDRPEPWLDSRALAVAPWPRSTSTRCATTCAGVRGAGGHGRHGRGEGRRLRARPGADCARAALRGRRHVARRRAARGGARPPRRRGRRAACSPGCRCPARPSTTASRTTSTSRSPRPGRSTTVARGRRRAGVAARVAAQGSTPACRATAATLGRLAGAGRRGARGRARRRVAVIGLWSHFACADEPGHPAIAAQLDGVRRGARARRGRAACGPRCGTWPTPRPRSTVPDGPLRPRPPRHRDVRPLAGRGPRQPRRARAAAGDDARARGWPGEAGAGGPRRLLRPPLRRRRRDHARRWSPLGYADGIPRQRAERRAAGAPRDGRRARSPGACAWTSSSSTSATTPVAAGRRGGAVRPGGRGEPTAEDWAAALRHHRVRDRHPDRTAGAARAPGGERHERGPSRTTRRSPGRARRRRRRLGAAAAVGARSASRPSAARRPRAAPRPRARRAVRHAARPRRAGRRRRRHAAARRGRRARGLGRRPRRRRAHRRLQPRLLPQPGLLALPAPRPARRWAGSCSGTSAATAAPAARDRPRTPPSTSSAATSTAVIDAAAPTGPLVLVGHSMGGMTIMSLRRPAPGAVRRPGRGVALVATTVGRLGEVRLRAARAGGQRCSTALPRGGRRRSPGARTSSSAGARAGSDSPTCSPGSYSFGVGRAAVAHRFVHRGMLAATPIDVVAEFLPDLRRRTTRRRCARRRRHEVEVLVLVGDDDLLTPVGHSEAIARRVPGAELVRRPGRRAPGDAGAPRGQPARCATLVGARARATGAAWTTAQSHGTTA